MNVNSVNGATSVVSTAPTAAATTSLTELPSATQSTVSPAGGLFGELASLAQSNPSQFKEVASEISDKLKQAATEATGDQAQFLSKMADKFSSAAQSGDVSALKPDGATGAKSAQGHHHHHHHASSAKGDGSATQPSPLDTVSQIIASALQDVTSGSATTGAT